jgi:DNA-binding NarL/FixJ family response regulator
MRGFEAAETIRSFESTPWRVMSSILLIQSDPAAASRIMALLAADSFLAVYASVGTLREARECIARRVPDLLITDLRLPDGCAHELLAELRPGRSHVLVLTGSLHDPHVMHTLRMGADALIGAGSSAEPLMNAVRRALAGESPIVAGVARLMLAHFDALNARPVPIDGNAPPPTLSAADRNLLEWAAEGYGAIDIASAVKTSETQVGLRMRSLFRRIQAERRKAPPAPRVLSPEGASSPESSAVR